MSKVQDAVADREHARRARRGAVLGAVASVVALAVGVTWPTWTVATAAEPISPVDVFGITLAVTGGAMVIPIALLSLADAIGSYRRNRR